MNGIIDATLRNQLLITEVPAGKQEDFRNSYISLMSRERIYFYIKKLVDLKSI